MKHKGNMSAFVKKQDIQMTMKLYTVHIVMLKTSITGDHTSLGKITNIILTEN